MRCDGTTRLGRSGLSPFDGGRSGWMPFVCSHPAGIVMTPSARAWPPQPGRGTPGDVPGPRCSADHRLKLLGRGGGEHRRLGRLQDQADGRRGPRTVAEQQLLERRIDGGLLQEDFDAAGNVADRLAAARRPPADDRRADRPLLGQAVGETAGRKGLRVRSSVFPLRKRWGMPAARMVSIHHR